MAHTATPLSENWTVKEVIDEVRSVTKEEDEQIATDDNVRAHLQWASHIMFKTFPAMRHEYLVDIPFVVDNTTDPMVSTLFRPVNSVTARPAKIIPSSASGTPPTLLPSGLYDSHYERPTNFVILGWWDVWNELTGTCRRTSDYTNLMGHSLNNNTQLARSVGWYDAGRQLWVSVREGMMMVGGTDVIIHGVGWRTPLKLINLVASTAPTGNADFAGAGTKDESVRYIPVVNDWENIDLPDDYVPIAINLAAIKVWSAVGKISKENEEAAIQTQLSSFLESTEQQMAQREVYRKDTQYKDRGHQ